mgnify:CR=1 FL=1
MSNGVGAFCPGRKCAYAVLLTLGATIGAMQLWGCPRCYQVYWRRPEPRA